MNQAIIPEKDRKPEEVSKNHHVMEVRGIGDLPHDLIIEILSRLPVKVLCKFRCVSKSWQGLLTRDKEFIARHIECSKRTPLLLIRRYLSSAIEEPSNTETTIELTSVDMKGDVTDRFKKVIDGPVHTFISCGSLSVLCCMYSLYVCNPSIREIVRVPYRPNSRISNIGFGYLPISNEYKIVHLYHTSYVGNGKMGCEIFSFTSCENVTTGSWTRIGDCPFSAWTSEYPVCVNGVIYWSLSSGWKDRSILSLDLKKQEFASISYPIRDSKKYSLLEYIGLMGGLCLVGFSEETSRMDIWMLKSRNKNWAMEYSINLSSLCPKLLISTDDHSQEILVHMEQRDLICYSLKSQNSRRIGYHRAIKNYNKPCLYYGSLVPLG
ncbi:F-box protein At1g30790-like [Henckelia pumila]|uniref:F-box protein At1g30790-like n=1 Tax=Henckelia pumila TaxID=405737 RepID=UPI003C6DBAD3